MKRLYFIALSGTLWIGFWSGVVEAAIYSVTVKDVNRNILRPGIFINDSFSIATPLGNGSFVEFQGNIVGVGGFTKDIVFSLSDPAFGRGFLASVQTVAGLDLDLAGGTAPKPFNPVNPVYTFAGLTSGITYTLIASGNAIDPYSGIAGSFQVLAVPEPEQWAMVVVGISLIAFQIRRKHKALGQGQGTISG